MTQVVHVVTPGKRWQSVQLRPLFSFGIAVVKLIMYTVLYLHVECFVCIFSDLILLHFESHVNV